MQTVLTHNDQVFHTGCITFGMFCFTSVGIRKSRTITPFSCLQKWSLSLSLGYSPSIIFSVKFMDFNLFSLVWHRQQMGRRDWFFYVSTTGCKYQGPGVPSCLYFNQYCLEPLSSDLAFLWFLYKLCLTLFSGHIKSHDGALSRLEVHFSPFISKVSSYLRLFEQGLYYLRASRKNIFVVRIYYSR